MHKFLFLPLFLFPFFINAQIFTTTSSHAEVKGSAPGSSYTGVSDKLEGTVSLTGGEVSFRLPIQSIDTGIEKRNRHMNDALETSQFPFAEFKGKLSAPVNINDTGEQMVTVKGNFTIHGQTKEIEVPTKITHSGNTLKFSADWPIVITEYGIKRPQFSFLKVRDLHHIYISGNLTEAK